MISLLALLDFRIVFSVLDIIRAIFSPRPAPVPVPVTVPVRRPR
jgi:hypothetical protein